MVPRCGDTDISLFPPIFSKKGTSSVKQRRRGEKTHLIFGRLVLTPLNGLEVDAFLNLK